MGYNAAKFCRALNRGNRNYKDVLPIPRCSNAILKKRDV